MSNTPERAEGALFAPPQLRRKMAVRALNQTRATVLAEKVALALGPWTRLRGLIGRPPLRSDQGLLIRPCKGIHTLMMRYPIDALFLDERGIVVAASENLRPWRMTTLHPRACCVLELLGGRAATSGTREGDRVLFGVACPS